MKLSEEEKKYASALYGKIFNDSYKRVKGNLDTLDEVYDKAFNLVKARLDSYKETYRKSGKVIDDEDKIEIFREIRTIVNRQCTEPFRIGRGFIRPPFSKEEVEGHLLKVISFVEIELEFIVREMEIDRKMAEKQESKEYEVLKWIFDKANGSQNEIVDLYDLTKENSKFKYEDLDNISNYLEGENLIKRPIDEGIFVQVTHRGIVEIRDKMRNPQKPTEHFPAPVIQHFNTFNAPVGSVLHGNENIINVQQNFGTKTEDVINLLGELKKHISENNKQEGLALINSLEKEIKSEKPSEPTIKLFLKGIGNFVKDTGKDLFVEIGKKLISGEIQFPNL